MVVPLIKMESKKDIGSGQDKSQGQIHEHREDSRASK